MKKTPRILTRAWRTRYAAVGAAVAVTLGAGGLAMVSADDTVPSSFVGITPARILDTRSDLGLTGPFVSGVPQLLQVTGPVPSKTSDDSPVAISEVVPPTATAVVMNLTGIGPLSPGFIAIRPGDAEGSPATSNMNFFATDNIKANAVTVALPADGKINIWVTGTISDVLIDIVGYYTPAAAPTSEVTQQAFEVQMSFGSSQTIATNGDLELSLRCREDDSTPDQDFTATDRNNMQFRAFSMGQYMTTYVDSQDLYDNEGVTIARALGSSTPGTMVQTTFVTRDGVRTAATMTGADGSQIAVDGDSVQVMFNVDNPTVTGGAEVDCYARGFVTLLPPR